MDIKEFFKEYFKKIYYKESNGGYIVSLPYYHIDADDCSSFYIKQNEDSTYHLSDMGNSIDHLEYNVDDYTLYNNKINKVCSRFGFTRNGKSIEFDIPNLETNQTMKQLHRFLQGLAIIANIDLF